MAFTSLQARLGPARPPFLLLTLSCVLLGVALSWPLVAHDTSWYLRVALVLLGGLAAHVSVNALNEYMDFKVGLDQITQRTPFSGGSGVLPVRPDLAVYALTLGLGALFTTMVIGVYFLWTVPSARMPLLLLGSMGVLLVAVYTPWLTRRPWLCLVAPGLGFGPAMVLGTQVVLVGDWTWGGVLASLLPFFFVNNLLLLNQFPDVDPDRRVGRVTLPMVLGFRGSVWVLAGQWLGGFGAVLVAVATHALPSDALAAMVFVPVAVYARGQLLDFACAVPQRDGAVPPAMALNVLLAVGAPLVLALGLLFGS